MLYTSAGMLDRYCTPSAKRVSPPPRAPHVELQQELEGLEALPVEEWNPFELDATDEAATSVTSKPTAGATGAASSDIAATSSTQRGRKRPRSPPSSNSITLSVERVCANPRSGQRTGEAGEAALEGDDSSADGDISSTAKRSRTAARVEPTPSLWMSQVCLVVYTYVAFWGNLYT